MGHGRWLGLALIGLGVALYLGAQRTQRARTESAVSVDVPVAAEDPALAPLDTFTDPWLPGMPGTRLAVNPFNTPSREPDPLENLMRDIGVDFRGIGGVSTGIGSPAQLEDQPSAGLDNTGAGLPAGAALRPSAGAHFNDGRDGDFRGRTENTIARRFHDQWKSIMSDMEPSIMPQVDTVVFTGDWSDDIAHRRPRSMLRWPSRRFMQERATLHERFSIATRGLTSGLTNFRPPVVLLDHDDVEDEDNPLFGAEEEKPTTPLDARGRAVESALAELSAEEEQRLLTEAESGDRASSVASAAEALEREKREAAEKKAKARRSWKRASSTPNTVRLTVGDGDELPLESMDIAVTIDGFRARVVVDAFFRNQYSKQLNGTFQLRLPTGASPHYLAFGRTTQAVPAFRPRPGASLADIRTQRAAEWSAPKEARMVSRERAAMAYTETVRRRIDPALMEWAGAGVFSTQVFPLEPQGMHRIVIAYDMDLQRDGDELVHTLDLPRGVPSLDVAITSDTTTRLENPKQAQVLTRVAAPKPPVLTGTSAQAGALFATEFEAPLPKAAAVRSERAVFLLDISASSTPERFNTWLALLDSILTQNQGSLREFAVGFFHVGTTWWREGFTTNSAANRQALRADAEQLMLEGATDLGAALAAANRKAGAFDVFLLSDGGATWGETSPYALGECLGDDHAVFGYVVPGGSADPALLGYLAQRSGGSVFPVINEDAVPRVATAHAARPWILESVALAGTEDLLLAGAPTVLFPGQVLRLAGRGRPAEDADVVLRVRQGTETRALRVALGARIDSQLTARTYGEIAVAQLEGLGDATAEEARAYASHFRVVGTSCSLLMLESEEDYKTRLVSSEDESMVAKTPAAACIAARRAEAVAVQDVPKRRFLAALDRLAALPDDMGTSVPPLVREALEALPEAAFLLHYRPLQVRLLPSHLVPKHVRDATADGSLSHAAASKEAERRRHNLDQGEALVALSTLVEQSPGDLVLTRDVAFSALAADRPSDAFFLLRRVAHARPWEHPTWLALARSLHAMGNTDMALPFYEIALHASSGRYGALRRVAAMEYARVLHDVVAGSAPAHARAFAKARLPDVRAATKIDTADLVVVIEWNTDRTDVDLHVTDPRGVHCYFREPTTPMGGRLSQDVTTGYGPELFVLPRAASGTYKFDVKYFGSDDRRTKARSKVFARIIHDYGRPTQRERRVTRVLKNAKQISALATETR